MPSLTSVLDESFLRQLAPATSGRRAAHQAAIIDGVGAALGDVLPRYNIDTPLRVVHFLAQAAHESDGFCTTEEYASGRAYEGQRDLGNTEPGDGVRFKGRGLIQVTGRSEYRRLGELLGLPLTEAPETVGDPSVSLAVSCEFWARRGLNARSDADDLVGVTRAVSGGLNGLDGRRHYIAIAKRLLAGTLRSSDVLSPVSGPRSAAS